MTHMSPEDATFYGLTSYRRRKIRKPLGFRDNIYTCFSLFTKILKSEYLVYAFE